jgi:hypothetical protein
MVYYNIKGAFKKDVDTPRGITVARTCVHGISFLQKKSRKSIIYRVSLGSSFGWKNRPRPFFEDSDQN